jgi:Domain of unknown function (DUF4395)
MRSLISFPNPVNEKAARVVAAGVLAMAVVTLATAWYWLLIPLAYGFVARVLTGPKLSPLGRLATRVIAPRLGPEKPVPGPPKRFAQGIGAVLTLAAAALALSHPSQVSVPADVLLALLVVAAGLESIAGYCIGCRLFAGLMRVGIVPSRVCEECSNIALRAERAAAASGS